jgi:hypothetical protein
MVTDLKNGYDSVVGKLGFDHQLCLRHFEESLNNRLKEAVKKNKIGEYGEAELKYYLKIILRLKGLRNYEEAKKLLKLLTDNFNEFPKIIQEILSDFVLPQFKSLTLFLRDPNVPKTNNFCENIFNKKNPRYKKNQGKTKEGTKARCALKERRWDRLNAKF